MFSDTECGRVRSVEFAGHSFETGGSIIHPANKHALKIIETYVKGHQNYGLNKTTY